MSELVERWPGYDEQSWAERFAELNRRHDSLFRSFNALHEEAIKALAEKRDRIEALERELAEARAELASRPQWADGQSPVTCGSGSVGFRAIQPTSEGHAAVLADLARRIDDE